EVKLGIAPGYGGTQRLPRIVGKGNALYLILTAEMIDAQEAYRIGLVNQVVPAGELLPTTETILRGILSMGPLAVRLALEAVDEDGIASVWVQLAQDPPVGADGLLDPVLEGPFRLTVPPGLGSGMVLPVKVQARDVVGFRSQRDTFVTVGP